MSVIVIVEMDAKPGQLATMIEQIAAILPETRKQPRCRSMQIFSDESRPDTMIAIEEWDDRPSYDAYLTWRIESGVMGELMQLAQAEPSIRFLSKTDV